MVQKQDVNNALAQEVTQKKKKKKKKRRHSEVESNAEATVSTMTVTQPETVELVNEKKRKKKKKKRKRENEECILHLEPSNQEEEWCEGGIWSLTSHPDKEKSKERVEADGTTPVLCESSSNAEDSSVPLKKKKKKKRKRQLIEALQATVLTGSASERLVLTRAGIFENN